MSTEMRVQEKGLHHNLCVIESTNIVHTTYINKLNLQPL